MKKAEIKLQVALDENNVPENIMWSSTDGNNAEEVLWGKRKMRYFTAQNPWSKHNINKLKKVGH